MVDLMGDDLAEELGRALGTDFVGIDSDLGEEEHALLRRTRAFVRDEVLPVISDYWERGEFPVHLARRMGELGLLGDGVDAPGVPHMTYASAGLVSMELSRGDGSLATFAGVQGGLAMRTIAELGSAEQRERWLGPLARAEAFGAFALTEPDHGSDSIGLETTARREGSEWVLDGAKRWIGNATIADLVIVWARNTEDGQVNGFVVETPTDGFEATKIEGKLALRSVWQADITLDGVRVPAENRLSEAHSFKDTGRVLVTTRSTCAWAALGHATAAYDTALTYAKQRKQFGKTLASFQIVQQRLVRMLAELTGMQLYCVQIGHLAEVGRLSPTVAGLAKMNNTRKAREIIADARDLLGGNGILMENQVMRHMADIEGIHTFEGTETMQTLIVGRDITGVTAFS